MEEEKEKIGKAIKNAKGITLISLIVTIVILIILATISINIVLDDDGLIKTAENAVEIQKMGEEKERLELIKVQVAIENKGKVPIDKYIEELIKEGITTEDEITENEDGSKEIITDNGYNVVVTPNGEEDVTIEIEGKAEALPVRIVNVRLTTGTNSIKVEVEVKRGEGAKYKYYIKTENTEYGEAVYEGKETSYTIEGLEQNVTYTVKVEAINENGTVYKEATGRTGEMPSAVGEVEFGELSWDEMSHTAEVEVTKNTNDGLKIVYRVLNEELNVVREYEEIQSGEKISGLKLGEIVEVRLTDGTNYGSTASLTVTDTTAPTITVTKGTVSTNSIAVTASGTDGQAGMPTTITYSYYIKKSSETSYPSTATGTNTTGSYTFTGLAQTTSYDVKVTAKDIAGNLGTGTLTGTSTGEITAASGNITFGSLSWSSNKASVTVTKGSSVSSSLSMQYKVENSSGTVVTNYTTITSGGKISSLSLGDVVTVRLTDGTNYGSTASLTVTDTTAPSAATISATTAYTITSGTTTTISATVTLTDNQSGVNRANSKWIINTSATKLGTTASSYTGGTFSSSLTISKTGVTKGTYYIHVLTVDKAGNAVETVSSAITVTQKVTGISVSPTTATVEVGKTTTITATVTPSTANNTGVTWSSSNTSVATVSGGTVTGKAAGTATITATASDGSGKKATCTVTVTQPSISTTTSYVGYYADIDGNGTVDGVIYADLAFSVSGTWSSTNSSTFSYTKLSSMKSYYVSQTNYAGDFGTKDVISATGSGNDRFYVMALDDFTTSSYSTFYWYNAAYGNISDYSTVTSTAFGKGKTNTSTMISKWKSSTYGSQNTTRDMWGVIQDKVSAGWFVPSKDEWSAFAYNLGITSSNYSSYGLSNYCWSSSLYGSYGAWSASFGRGYMIDYNINYYYCVRLSATF